ncbi:transposase-like protein [Paraburkholderia sp. GAS38]
MPRKPKTAIEAQTALPSIPKELIDQFVKGPMTAEAVHAASAAFRKALIERALGAELGHHLGYPAGAVRPEDATNQRNGKSGKTVLTDDGPLRLEIPRDRDGSFAPILIPKHERRFTGFDDKIIAMYARGMTVREIQGFLAAAIKPIYTAAGAEAAQAELEAFEQGEWGQKFPTVVAAWRRAWDRVIPFFAFPPAVRKVIYTQRNRKRECPATQDRQDAWTLPK